MHISSVPPPFLIKMMMGHYGDVKCKLGKCALRDVAKNGLDHHYGVNRTWILLEKLHHIFRASRFVIECVPVCNVASKIAKVILPS